MSWLFTFADPAPTPLKDPVDPELARHAGPRETVADEVNATLLVLLPWGISALIHAGVILLAFFVVWTVVASTQDNDVIVPTLELADPAVPLRLQDTPRLQLDAPRDARGPRRPTPG